MYTKKLKTGKVKYVEKFFDERLQKWREVTVTLKNATRETGAEAKILLAQKIEALKITPTEAEIKKAKQADYTVGELFKDWQEIRKEELKATTYKAQSQIFDVLLRTISDRPLKAISVQEIQSILFSGERSIKTKRAYKAMFQQFLDYAVDLAYLSENPVKNIRLPKRKLTLEDVQKAKDKFIDTDEMEQIISFAKSEAMNLSNNHAFYASNQHSYLYAYIFLYCTALRVGELQALRFSDIDGNVAHISHSIDRRNHKENERVLVTPKTVHSFRDVQLNAQALEIIDFFKREKRDKDFIFCNDKGELLVYKTLEQNFKKLCEKALGNKKAYTLHMLRHSAISFMAEQGLSDKAIMAQVGHAKNDMTLHYTHLTKQMEAQTLDKLNGLNFGLTQKS